MEDIHKEYLADGDIIYAPKPLNIETFAGKKRVKLKYYLVNAVNVKKCIIEWDNGEASKTIDITPKIPLDSIEVIVDNLEERSYIFKVYTVDNNGNRSIKEQVTGSAYDARYLAGLTNRPVIGISGGGTVDSVVVLWGTPPAGNTHVEIKYLNTDETEVGMTVPDSVNRTVIRNWKSETDMSIVSFYIPEPTAIDTFHTVATTAKLPVFIKFDGEKLSKEGWQIVNYSTQEPAEGAPNGLATAAIDGNINSFWHTQWSGGNPGYPHHFTFDMGEIAKLSKFDVFRRQGDNRGQTRFEIHTSMDGVNFTRQGSFEYDNTINSATYNLPGLPMARYIKYVATAGPNFLAFLAEIDLYGQYAEQVNRSEWAIVDFSTEEPAEANWGPPIQGRAAAVIDGELGTFWHTQWDGANPPYPHHFTIDMKKTIRVLAVESFRRQGNSGGQSKYKIYTSNDGVNFTDQGEFDFDRTINAGQMVQLPMMPEARFIKYVATQGPNFYAFLAEFYVYGKEL
jgi:hypothetical protein